MADAELFSYLFHRVTLLRLFRCMLPIVIVYIFGFISWIIPDVDR